MKYTYRLLTNPEMSTDEQEFVTGLLQAFELNPAAWTRIENGEEVPEVNITVGHLTGRNMEQYSMFSIGWMDNRYNKTELPVDEWRNYTAGHFGSCSFGSDTNTYYFKHENDIFYACEEIPNSKGFFPSLKRLYSTDTPNQFGYAVGCALNDLMLVESIYEEKEEQA